MENIEKGCIHIYTGNGKGKTTAAFGLALRAIGNNKEVFIGQFIKSMIYSEVKAAEKYLPYIEIQQFGKGCLIDRVPEKEDINDAYKGLEKMQNVLQSDNFDVVIFDEVTIPIYFNLLNSNDLLNVLKHKKDRTEIIITGRYAPPELIEIADLVTEMVEVKHYYNQGVLSRKGIDC
ncbi:MAG: cob(I)yrinic acid a,c-diamide adenosyltransferase [Ignavibacteria bacterium]|nr:cob(I)yrinic acid a,c-diamide adenosyltransferase [Ignavibacteria bacterium]